MPADPPLHPPPFSPPLAKPEVWDRFIAHCMAEGAGVPDVIWAGAGGVGAGCGPGPRVPRRRRQLGRQTGQAGRPGGIVLNMRVECLLARVCSAVCSLVVDATMD